MILYAPKCGRIWANYPKPLSAKELAQCSQGKKQANTQL